MANYYVSSSGGNDSNNGTSTSTPWQNHITKINQRAGGFQPGDVIHYKGGDVFEGGIVAPSHGTEGNEIVFTSYGTGKAIITDLPASNYAYTELVRVSKNYVLIDSLEVTDVLMSESDHSVDAKAEYGILVKQCSNVKVNNCKIHKVGMGVYWYQADHCEATQNEVFNLRVVHDNPTVNNDDWGANPFFFWSSDDNLIQNNVAYDCWGNSVDFGYDGGGVEFDNSNRNQVLNNSFKHCNGLMEFGTSQVGGTAHDNLFKGNRVENCGNIAYLHLQGDFGCDVRRLTIEKNVFIETEQFLTNPPYMIDAKSVGVTIPNDTIRFIDNVVYITKAGLTFTPVGKFNSSQLIESGTTNQLVRDYVTTRKKFVAV